MAQHQILVVDDTPANLQVVSQVFRQASQGADQYRVFVANDGVRALAMLGIDGSTEKRNIVEPDLILLDVMMPGIDGWEVCQRLKSHPTTQDIPVIFLTALDQVGDVVKGFDLGAVDYIPKPFQQKELLARVRTHLRLRDLMQAQRLVAERLEETVRLRTTHIQEMYDRMARVDADRGSLVTTVCQEIGSLVGQLRTHSRTLRTQVDGQAGLAGQVDAVADDVDRLDQLSRLLLGTSGGTETHGTLSDVAPQDVITAAMNGIREECQRRRIRLQLQGADGLPTMTADRAQLEQAFGQVLAFVASRTPDGSAVSLSVTFQDSWYYMLEPDALTPNGEPVDSIRVTIEDQGPGLSRQDLDALYGAAFRRSAQLVSGSGTTISETQVGIAHAAQILKDHGGRLSIDSTAGRQGAICHLLVPLKPDTI